MTTIADDGADLWSSAGAAIGLAACSGPSSPHVASLGKTSGDGSVSTTTMPAAQPDSAFGRVGHLHAQPRGSQTRSTPPWTRPR